ncbi:MAG TPA: hypothetical protein VFL79_05560, partial [Terriglobia bacterium]|nr:hypothetical protein [Terriglobia bacterium]
NFGRKPQGIWRATVDTFRTFLARAAGNPRQLEQTQQFLNQRVQISSPAQVPLGYPAGIPFELEPDRASANLSLSCSEDNLGGTAKKLS